MQIHKLSTHASVSNFRLQILNIRSKRFRNYRILLYSSRVKVPLNLSATIRVIGVTLVSNICWNLISDQKVRAVWLPKIILRKNSYLTNLLHFSHIIAVDFWAFLHLVGSTSWQRDSWVHRGFKTSTETLLKVQEAEVHILQMNIVSLERQQCWHLYEGTIN